MRQYREYRTRSAVVVEWVEKFCRVPSGLNKGGPVQLSAAQRERIARLYGNHLQRPHKVDVGGDLGAYLVLLHLVGSESMPRKPVPDFAADTSTVLRAASPALRKMLQLDGSTIVCKELGTVYKPSAAPAATVS